MESTSQNPTDTTTPPLPDIVELIRGLLKESTKGEWTVEVRDGYITGHIISPLHTYSGNAVSRKDSVCDPNSLTRRDAEFIVAAHNHLPDLLAIIDGLRADRPQWTKNPTIPGRYLHHETLESGEIGWRPFAFYRESSDQTIEIPQGWLYGPIPLAPSD